MKIGVRGTFLGFDEKFKEKCMWKALAVESGWISP